jgi:hypothetical protein
MIILLPRTGSLEIRWRYGNLQWGKGRNSMWPFDIRRKRRKVVSDVAINAWDTWQRALYIQGFNQWVYRPPANGIWIEATRREWASNQVWKTGDENPWMNVADLWWRPWRGDTIEQKIVDGEIQ